MKKLRIKLDACWRWMQRRVLREPSKTPQGWCHQCRHYTRDRTAQNMLGVNFPVGRCAKGRVISYGVVRGHDSCELFKAENAKRLAHADENLNRTEK